MMDAPLNLKHRAIHQRQTGWPEAAYLRRIAMTLERVLRAQAQHTITPLIGVGPISEPLARRPVNPNHLVNVTLLLRDELGFACTRGKKCDHCQ